MNQTSVLTLTKPMRQCQPRVVRTRLSTMLQSICRRVRDVSCVGLWCVPQRRNAILHKPNGLPMHLAKPFLACVSCVRAFCVLCVPCVCLVCEPCVYSCVCLVCVSCVHCVRHGKSGSLKRDRPKKPSAWRSHVLANWMKAKAVCKFGGPRRFRFL